MSKNSLKSPDIGLTINSIKSMILNMFEEIKETLCEKTRV